MMTIIRTLILVTAVTLSGCSAARELSMGPFIPSEALAADGSTLPYSVVVGDVIDIKFPFHPELDTVATVRSDGHVGVPSLGEFRAAGLTTWDLSRDLLSRASVTYREPTVSVVIREMAVRRVYVGGEVGDPGYVRLRPGMTSFRAIVERGGLKRTAKADSVLLVRWKGPGDYEADRLDLEAMIDDGDASADALLGPNDVVFVPRTWIANANNWVDQYIRGLIPVREPSTRLPNIGN